MEELYFFIITNNLFIYKTILNQIGKNMKFSNSTLIHVLFSKLVYNSTILKHLELGCAWKMYCTYYGKT